MSATPAREPVAQGSLAETPLCHLGLYLYRRNTSGTLLISNATGNLEASVRVEQGRPVAARFATPALTLLDGLVPLCGLRDGGFSFFDVDLMATAENLVTGAVDPYALLVASLREHAREDMVEAILKRYQGSKLRIQPGRDLERLGLQATDKPLIELIRAAPAAPEELVAQSPLPAQRTRHLVYALIVTHMVTLHEERNRETYRSQVEIRSGRPVVGQPNDVASSAIPAWQQLVSLRPGAVTSARPGAMPTSSVSMPPRPSSRPAGSGSTPAPIPQVAVSLVPDGEDRGTKIRRAEHFLSHNRCDDALAVVDELIKEAPEDAAILALRGHALFEKHRVSPKGLPKSVLDALRKALEIDPDQRRAVYVRGLVYKQAGDMKKATACWKRVLQIDPKHLEAQRELRLAKLRGGT
jgi:hypothetical protein